jgi:periplasmic divalent cation tolerance protein
MSERVLVLTTVATAEDAERLAEALVERRLCACVNVVRSVRSIYRWKGAVEREDEQLLLVKTRSERLPALRDAVLALHPYEVPELIALPIEAGSPAYLDWLDASVREE